MEASHSGATDNVGDPTFDRLIKKYAAGAPIPSSVCDRRTIHSVLELPRSSEASAASADVMMGSVIPFRPSFPCLCRQVSGVCGAELPGLRSWTASYDELAGDRGPSGGKVQLNLLVCAPYGEYELELSIDSYSKSGSGLERRTSWEVLTGPDGVRLSGQLTVASTFGKRVAIFFFALATNESPFFVLPTVRGAGAHDRGGTSCLASDAGVPVDWTRAPGRAQRPQQEIVA